MGERYSVGRTKKKKKRIPNKIKKKNKSNPLNRRSEEGIFSICCKKMLLYMRHYYQTFKINKKK